MSLRSISLGIGILGDLTLLYLRSWLNFQHFMEVQPFARYLSDVLGVQSIIFDPPKVTQAPLNVRGAGQIMFLGEGIFNPNDFELLNKMIVAMGLDPLKVYLAEGNLKDIEQVNTFPIKILILMGPHDWINNQNISQFGIWENTGNIKTMITYSPRQLLKQPELKKTVWNDLKKVMTVLKELDN